MNDFTKELETYVANHQNKMRKYLKKAGCDCKKSRIVYANNKGARCTSCNKVAMINDLIINEVEGL